VKNRKIGERFLFASINEIGGVSQTFEFSGFFNFNFKIL